MTLRPPPQERDTARVPQRALYLLIGASMLNHSVIGGTRLAIALYALHLHATPFTVGVLMALNSLIPMLFAVLVGRLVDRTGVRRPMAIASIVLVLATLLPTLWPGMPALYIASLVIGAGFMVYNVSLQHLLGYIGPPEDRMRNFRSAALGFSISGVIGPLITGFGIEWIGYGFTFLCLALFPLVPAALLASRRLTLPRPPAPSAPPGQRRRLVDLLRNREMRNIFLAGGLIDMAWDLFAFAMPVHGSQIGLSPATIGTILGAFSAATFVIRVLLPITARWLGAWPQIIVSLFATGVAFALLAYFESAPVLIGLGFVLGLCVGSTQPLVLSLLHGVTPAGRFGEAMGIRAAINGMNQTGLPLLFGGLGAAVGMVPVFWATAALFMVSGIAARTYRRRS